ncbi:enoyl-CoA hydratase/isomerase family protein [Sinomonas sp. JGH33]|uniref:Enoyl-CoA hydratase/isomerase family protein n=1 Tax=Sinomonas terricola TaxID=3110330 RepID=A0ABU5T9V2_9MICC|nr:enoyl-CoA hydratase/isomerase family protein [Sinomonas sp. JGH33]MEA5456299.1 enoyl-CoA hydratase/isomerase family protein [Sinomonas sp. JGH33]
MNDSQVVLTRVDGPVGWIRLNRPEALNALNADLVPQLDAALTRFEQDPAIRVLVITGTGRAFCAGGDLNSFDPEEKDTVHVFLERAAETLEHIPSIQKPVIAALNGVTAAGGLEIAMACDLVIAARSVRIGDGHANFGLLPGAGGAVRLARAVGPARAKYLSFTGQLFPADFFLSWGLVNEVVDDDELDQRVQELAETIAAKSPIVLAGAKQLIDESFDQPLEAGLRAERIAMYAHMQTQDMREGLAAFAEKRTPHYTGQ